MSGILNLVLIGARSSGKTIYLSTLWGKAFLSDTNEETKKYLKNTWDYIEENKKAQATSGMYKDLHFSYIHEKFGRLNFSLDDYDGSFTEGDSEVSTEKNSEEGNNNKSEIDKLFSSVHESEGCIFFIPYEDSVDRLKDFAQEIDAFIEKAHFESHSKSPIPASIVITKWDESDSFQAEDELLSAEKYIENSEHLKRVVKLIKDNFQYTQLIPISSFKEYQLLNPIDFSFKLTFKQWYERSSELKEESNFKKLTHYLSRRYHDIKFNETYNFTDLYNEAQEQFAKEISKEFQTLKGHKEKEQYLAEHKEHFKTKKNLLKPFEKEIRKEKWISNLKKALVGIGVVGVVLFGFMSLKKVSINEEYENIMSKHDKGMKYQDLKSSIDGFLQNYQTDDFLLSLSDIATKRKKLNDISNIIKVTHTNQEVQKNIDNWKVQAQGCLNSCDKQEDGVEIIASLIINSENFTEKSKILNMIASLQDLKNKILIESEINKVDKFDDLVAINLTAFDSAIKNKLLTKLKEKGEEFFKTREGIKVLEELNEMETKEHFKKYMVDNIKPAFDRFKNFSDLKNKIEKTDRYIDLKNLEYGAYKKFNGHQQSQIKGLLDKKMDSFFRTLKDEKPSDNDSHNTKTWIDKLKKLRNFSISDISYNYTHANDYVSNEEDDYIGKKSLENKGIDHISVSFSWEENNELDLTSSDNEVIIEGFSSTLTYEESEGDNNTIKYNTKITLKKNVYNLIITEDDVGLLDERVIKKLPIDIQDIENLDNSAMVIKRFDDGLTLTFSKSDK